MNPPADEPIKIISWNANGISNKKDELAALIQQIKPDIIFIQETRLNRQRPPKIHDYNCINKPKTIAGGLMTYVHKTINFVELPTNTNNSESQAFQIGNNNTLINFYNGHQTPLDVDDLEHLTTLGNKTTIIGDYNAKHTDWNCPIDNTNGKELKKFIESTTATLHNPENQHTCFQPHCRPSTIDLVISNNSIIKKIETLEELNSDHYPILIEVQTDNPFKRPPKITRTRTTDWEAFREQLRKLEIKRKIDSEPEIDHQIKLITENINKAFIRATTENPLPSPDRRELPQDILDKIKRKNNLRKLAQRTWNPLLIQQIKQLTNDISTQIRSYRNLQWEKTLERTMTKDKTRLWRLAKNLRQREQVFTIPALQHNNTTINTDEGKATVMADQFENTHRQTEHLSNNKIKGKIQKFIEILAEHHFPTPPNEYTTPNEISKIIRKLKTNKAAGEDRVNASMLKNLPTKTVVQIYYIMNAALKLQYFPTNWKNAIVIPIHKRGKPTNETASYRPISLLPIISKVYEKILLRKLKQFSDKIIPEQFGFQPRKCTTLQLARVSETIRTNYNLNRSTAIMTLDIEKAFDTVWKDALLYKLHVSGIPTYLLKTIQSYNTGRTFQVKVEEEISSKRTISAGVPQGAVLSPTLFNFFINDIPTTDHTSLALFADDTAVIADSWDKNKAIEYIQRHTNLLEKYFKAWKIKINANKTNLTVFSMKKDTIDNKITLNNTEIEATQTTTYLGIKLDQRLTFSHHIQDTTKKAARALGLLHPLLNKFSPIEQKTKLYIYKTYILPIITYGCPIWYNIARYHIAKLQRIQNKALRTILDKDRYERTKHLHEEAGIDTIEDRLNTLATKFFTTKTKLHEMTKGIGHRNNTNTPFKMKYKLTGS